MRAAASEVSRAEQYTISRESVSVMKCVECAPNISAHFFLSNVMVKRKNLTSDDLLRRQEEEGSQPKKVKLATLNLEQDITSDYSDASSSRSVRSPIQVNGQHDNEDFSDEFSGSEDEKSFLEVSERLNASRLPERIEPIRNTQPRLPASFSELGVSSSIQNALKTMSIHTPTEIQTACIPPLLDGMFYVCSSLVLL